MDERIALERMHTDASHVVGPNPGDTPTWLNAVGVVNDIVSAFASDVLRNYAASAATEEKRAEFAAWLNLECTRLGNLFLGYGINPDDQYKRGLWNTPDQLGAFLRIRYAPSDEDCRFAVRDAFALYALETITISNSHIGEDVSQWGGELDASAENLVRSLLGLPPGNDPDEETPVVLAT